MHSLKEIKSIFKFLSETLQDYGTMPIFKRTFSQDLDLLEQHLTKDILSRTDCTTTFTDLRTKFENAFHSEFEERMQKYTRFDSIGKYMHEITLHQQRTPQVLKQKKLMQTQDDHSHPIPALNIDSLKVDFVVIQNTSSEKEDKSSDILKQHQNEVNEIRAERLARNANPAALVAQQQPVYHPQNHPTQNTQYSSTRSQESTRNRGKAIVTSSAPTYDIEPIV
ncbi:hypothetical protein Tco_1416241 [Tanacetum coccineum]